MECVDTTYKVPMIAATADITQIQTIVLFADVVIALLRFKKFKNTDKAYRIWTH